MRDEELQPRYETSLEQREAKTQRREFCTTLIKHSTPFATEKQEVL